MLSAKLERAQTQFQEIQMAIQSKKSTIDNIVKNSNEQIAGLNKEIEFLEAEGNRLQGEFRVLKELMNEQEAVQNAENCCEATVEQEVAAVEVTEVSANDTRELPAEKEEA